MTSIDRRQLRPVECEGLIRLGARGDGGYVVPWQQVTTAAVLLSLGMKDDWSFDRAFSRANPRAKVIVVDRSTGPPFFARRVMSSLVAVIRARLKGDKRDARRHAALLRNGVDYFLFFAGRRRHLRKMVCDKDSVAGISMASLLDATGSERDHAVFLKMDIEGAEYGLAPVIADRAMRFGCVVAEFHGLARTPELFNKSIAILREHFDIVHVHGNNYSRYDPDNDFPNTVEITFVNKALMPHAAIASSHDYPRAGLDWPNCPRRPDHPLRFD